MNKNGVEIKGLLDPSTTKDLNSAGTVIYSEIDYIFISKRNYPIVNLKSILINIEILNERKIELKDSSIISLDGVKKFTIEYMDNQDKKIILNKSVPFNSFFEIPEDIINYTGFKINILDAFFHNIDEFTIYSYLNYLITIDGTPLNISNENLKVENIESKTNPTSQINLHTEKDFKHPVTNDIDIVDYYYDLNFANTPKENLDVNKVSTENTISDSEIIYENSSTNYKNNITPEIPQIISTDDSILNDNSPKNNVDLDEEFM